MSRENFASERPRAYSTLLVIFAILINGASAKPPVRLIGGSDAQLGEMVSQASLRQNGKHYCGGTLISTRHVLTAGHCVSDFTRPYQGLTVVTGTNSLTEGGTTSLIEDIDVHENFTSDSSGSWHDDIAIIKLRHDIEVDTYQSPIGLPDNDTPAHQVGIVSGWGYKDYNDYPDGDYSKILQKSDMTILTNQECEFSYKTPIQHENLCGYKNSLAGICEGDAGGPMIYDNSVVGIASWYYPCALGLPDVYTRVYHYLGWILEIMSRGFHDESGTHEA